MSTSSTEGRPGVPRKVIGLAIAGAVGGFLFGFDSSVVNGAVDAIKDEFALSEAVTGFAVAVALLLGFANVWWYQDGFFTEWDNMAGTYGLFVFAFIEIWLVRLAFGIDEFWTELHLGADIRIPGIFKFVLGWVSPAFITILAVWYAVTAMIPELLMQGIAPEQVYGRWLGRLALLGMLAVILFLIRAAFKRNGDTVPAGSSTLEVNR